MNTFIREFNSIHSMVDFLNNKPNGKYPYPSSSGGSKSFTMTSSYKEAIELLTGGWSEAAEKITAAVVKPSPQPTKARRSVYSVAGHTASVPRYLQGVPTSMIASVPDVRKQPVVVINHSISYAGMWKADAILKEGIKAVQVVQAIEASGRRVKLNIVAIGKDGNYRRGFKVCIKQPSERLNISKMAFPLAHPSMLRRLFFKYLEVEPDMPITMDGYGTPDAKYIAEMNPKELYIPEKVDVEKIISKIL